MSGNVHEYSIDVDNKKIYFFLALFSFIVSMLIATILNYLISITHFIEISVSISSLSLFGIFYTLFDKYVWKWKLLTKIGIVKTPNLNGEWKGELYSSYFNFAKKQDASLIIEQNWSKIYIKGNFNQSSSSSNTTSLKVNSGGSIKLLYSYYNDKHPEYYQQDNSNHRGYANLEISDNIIKGNYFNDPTNNKNHGKLHLKKVV